MFNNTISLIKVLSKSLYDLSFNNSNKKKKTSKGAIIAILIIVGVFCVVPFFISGFATAQLVLLQKPDVLPNLWNIILPIFTLAILLLSIITIISVFFLSSENKILLPLPLKSWEILLARFVSALFLIYIIEGLIFAPTIIGLGVGSNLNVLGYISLVITLFALPVLPVAIVGTIFTLLSSIINFAKYKDAFNYILIAFAIIISLGVSLLTTASSGAIEGNPESIESLINAISSGGEFIKFIPTLIPAVNALTSNNILIQILNILLFVAINIAIIAIFVILFHKSYYKILKKFDGIQSSRKKLSNNEYHKETKTSSSFLNGIMIEWKTVARSSIFFSNTILPVFLVPVVLLVSFFVGATQEELNLEFILNELNQINITLENPIILLIVLGIFVFFGSMNMTSATAISRMGNNASFIKFIPMSSIRIVHIKIFWGVFLSSVISLILSILLVVFNFLTILDALIIFILSSFVFVFLNYLGLYFDLRKPMIHWDNETAAVKNNLNTLWYILACFAIIIGVVIIGIIITSLNLPLAGYVLAGIIFILSLIGNYLFYRYYSRGSKVIFDNI